MDSSGEPARRAADRGGPARLAADVRGSRSRSTTTASTVLKAGPWSQAPVFLQQLRLLEGFDLAALGHGVGAYVHTVTECAKLAFADREAWYGDPEFVDVPIDVLLSREYADERRTLIGEEASSSCDRARPAVASRASRAGRRRR